MTRDILDSRGAAGIRRAPRCEILDAADHLEWEYLPEAMREITARPRGAVRRTVRQHPRRCPAPQSLREDRRLRVVARHGVGFDSVDVAGDDARRRASSPTRRRRCRGRSRRSR